MRHGVYVLALQNGGYYVGKSRDIDARVQQHRNGTGSAWCRHQGGVLGEVPTVVAGSLLDIASWEMSETVTQMLIHGFENVRGWEFSSCVALSCRECDTIKTIVMGQGDLCRRCGGEGHFATGCSQEMQPWLLALETLKLASVPPPVPARNMIAAAAMAFAGGSSGTEAASAPETVAEPAIADISNLLALGLSAKKDGHGTTLQQIPIVLKPAHSQWHGVACCARCGRDSHNVSSCFALKHFNGSELKARSPKKG